MSDVRERIARILYEQECRVWGVPCPSDGYAGGEKQRTAYLNRADELHAALSEETEPVAETLYTYRCGWCGAYEGTVESGEPCAKDSGTGEYIGPHQFGVVERFDEPVYRCIHCGTNRNDWADQPCIELPVERERRSGEERRKRSDFAEGVFRNTYGHGPRRSLSDRRSDSAPVGARDAPFALPVGVGAYHDYGDAAGWLLFSGDPQGQWIGVALVPDKDGADFIAASINARARLRSGDTPREGEVVGYVGVVDLGSDEVPGMGARHLGYSVALDRDKWAFTTPEEADKYCRERIGSGYSVHPIAGALSPEPETGTDE